MIDLSNTRCPDCGATLQERGKSRRVGELLLICAGGHKWQGTLRRGKDGAVYLHPYRSSRRGGEKMVVRSVRIRQEQDNWLQSLPNASETTRDAFDLYRKTYYNSV